MQSHLCKRFVCLVLICQLSLSLSALARIIKSSEIDYQSIKAHFIFDTAPANLEELIESSDRIFTGTCTNAEVIKNDKRAKLPVVRYTFEIQEGIKGVSNKDKINFKQWEPTTRDSGYETGKKYVLFLYPNSALGLTSPVGFLQGQFTVQKDINNNETVINKISNSGLTRNIKAKKILSADKTYSRIYNQIEESSEKAKKINYKEFIELIKYLMNQT